LCCGTLKFEHFSVWGLSPNVRYASACRNVRMNEHEVPEDRERLDQDKLKHIGRFSLGASG
jgi:hypothetical protein